MQLTTSPSPGSNATNGRGIAAGLSPAGRGRSTVRYVAPRPIRGEAGPVSFRGRVRGNPLPQLHRSGSDSSSQLNNTCRPLLRSGVPCDFAEPFCRGALHAPLPVI